MSTTELLESHTSPAVTPNSRDKGYRGAASQFYVAAELCRRGYAAVVTMGNCPNTDVLCSNLAGTKFVHIQVKTFRPGKDKTCSIGAKAEKDYGDKFFWVLGGIPEPESTEPFVFYVIPSGDISKNIREGHKTWADTPGKKGQQRNGETKLRTVQVPPGVYINGWDLEPYRNDWAAIERALND